MYQMNSSTSMIELLDLPDEMISAIMNKVESRVEMLCNFVGIGNSRLERIALDQRHSIDLTFNSDCSTQELFIARFYSYIMPRIYNNIRSITFNFKQLLNIVAAVKAIGDGTLPNLTHLKIISDHRHPQTGAYITDLFFYEESLLAPLLSTVPQFFRANDATTNGCLSFFRRSSLMRSIVSFEFDDYCALSVPPSGNGLFFAQSPHLTHVRVTLRTFGDCIRLLSQLSSQVRSFAVSLLNFMPCQDATRSQMTLMSCPNLKQLTLTIYRNTRYYEQCIVPFLQRFSAVEHLTLLLAIGVKGMGPDHFIDGFDLQRGIISYMPHLHRFQFHIRSILRDAPDIKSDTIRQSFIGQQQPVDCVLDYFYNGYSQCQIYSLPFIGTRLDFISNRFPLFNINNRFSNVTTLSLFDHIQPFESVFFGCLARVLPRLQILEIYNGHEQKEKTTTMTPHNIEFAHLATLILFDIHMDYADQLLCRTRLPSLVELIIHKKPLLAIVAQNPQQSRENCSKIETLRTVASSVNLTHKIRNFFPSFHTKNL